MRRIEIEAQTGRSVIAVGEKLHQLGAYVNNKKTVIITDKNLRRCYESQFPPWPIIEIGTGESIKNLDTANFIYKQLLELGVDRSSVIVGIGGGIVCDITGFVASTFMRGIDFGFVSTSLLSQVDASTGGKNGVNFQGYKNMIGVFNQPMFVICDPVMLKTLPQNELLSGFAEVVKHGAIADSEYFEFLEKNVEAALTLEEKLLEKIIHRSVTIKAAVVRNDEKEKGERRKLNFGHTLGHALENTTGITHGEAVSIGMVFAAELSVRKKLLAKEQAQRLKALLQSIGLPTEITCSENKMNEVLDALKKDKKKEGEEIHFILLNTIGNAIIEEIPMKDILNILKSPNRET